MSAALALKRDDTGRFLPGVSPNPSGRPKGFKGLAAMILKESRNGEEFCDFAFRVLRNEGKNYKHSDQVEMLKILLDRGFGKPTTTIIELPPEEAPSMIDVTEISAEALENVTEALASALKSIPASVLRPSGPQAK